MPSNTCARYDVPLAAACQLRRSGKRSMREATACRSGAASRGLGEATPVGEASAPNPASIDRAAAAAVDPAEPATMPSITSTAVRVGSARVRKSVPRTPRLTTGVRISKRGELSFGTRVSVPPSSRRSWVSTASLSPRRTMRSMRNTLPGRSSTREPSAKRKAAEDCGPVRTRSPAESLAPLARPSMAPPDFCALTSPCVYNTSAINACWRSRASGT